MKRDEFKLPVVLLRHSQFAVSATVHIPFPQADYQWRVMIRPIAGGEFFVSGISKTKSDAISDAAAAAKSWISEQMADEECWLKEIRS